jgi:hypothetical protein
MANYLVKIQSLKLRKSTTALSTGFFLVLLLLFIPANILEFNNAWATPTEIPVYMLTTRGDREQAEGVEEELGYNDKYPLHDINELYTGCPEETAIFVMVGVMITTRQRRDLIGSRCRWKITVTTFH